MTALPHAGNINEPPARRSGPGGWLARVASFWRGELSLGRSFWIWGVVGGGFVNFYMTMFALVLLAADAPGWMGAVLLAAPIPWNLVLLVGVWHSAGREGVAHGMASLARVAIVGWVSVLCLV